MLWDETQVERVSDEGSVRRGRALLAAGKVLSRAGGPTTTEATVAGSRGEVYDVWLAPGRWSCTCPVGDEGRFCKHCVAVALGEDGPSARPATRVAVTASEVEGVLRDWLPSHRGYLDYWQSIDHARQAQVAVDALTALVAEDPDGALALSQKGVRMSLTLLRKGDDSSGVLGDLVRSMLTVHRVASEAADPSPARRRRTARWLVKLVVHDQDWFDVDPVEYRAALGDEGLEAFRAGVEKAWADDVGYDAGRLAWVRQRFAVLSGDVQAVLAAHLPVHSAHQVPALVEDLLVLGRPDLALDWAVRWVDGLPPRSELRTTAARLLVAAGDTPAAVDLVEAAVVQEPWHGTWQWARARLDELGLDDGVQQASADRMLRPLAEMRPEDHVRALLDLERLDQAWTEFGRLRQSPEGTPLSLMDQVASAVARSRPADSYEIWQEVVLATLVTTGKQQYATAAGHLARMRGVASALGRSEHFASWCADLAHANRRRPTLVALLRQRGFVG